MSDSPVGTGFSFTEAADGYARSMDDVTRDLYRFLNKFFDLYPQLRGNNFFIAGESYGETSR